MIRLNRISARRGSPGTLAALGVAAVLAAALSGGCADSSADGEVGPLDPVVIFGMQGRSAGQFVYPRAIDVDTATRSIYVIDTTGRVQRFDYDGTTMDAWFLPRFDDGYPTGLTIAPDGRLFVADTHNFCVSVFDRKGNLLGQFGSHGTGPGQFIFPSDVAFGHDGRIYVSEFGGNDRIQVFDADWEFLFEFGQPGTAPGHLNRPQGLTFTPDGSQLFVADSCNHRIQVFDPEGNLMAVFGAVGTEAGQFRYPYGVKFHPDGSLLVTEFGNSRVQVLTPGGEPQYALGRAGNGPGELYTPWDAVPADGLLFIVDSRNNRVQIVELN